MSTEEERIRQWRAQLAEEADSDDDEGFGMAPPSLGMGIGRLMSCLATRTTTLPRLAPDCRMRKARSSSCSMLRL